MATPPLYAQHVHPQPYDLPELPTTISTSDAQEYSVAGDVWVFPEVLGRAAKVKIDWTLLSGVVIAGTSTPVMSTRAVTLFKLYILGRLSAVKNPLKPRSAKSVLHSMLNFARWLAAQPDWQAAGRCFDWSDMTVEMFRAWITAEYRTKRKGDSVLRVRRFYWWGSEPGASWPDFSADTASLLCSLRIKGHPEGKVVEIRDKRRGAFTREELESIFRACEAGAGKDCDRAITRTLLETAIRPVQMYLLANQDLEVIEEELKEGDDGSTLAKTSYRLRVRKVKQRSTAIEYHYLPLSEGCAKLLHSLRKPESGPHDPLFWWLRPSYENHILLQLKSFSHDADLRSTRLPIENPVPGGPIYELLHITPRRFRYGLATDRIKRGDGPEDVANMLGHKGTGSVHIYVETSPGIADDFQQATDYVVVPLIDLMEGRARLSKDCLLACAAPPSPPTPRPFSTAPMFPRGATAYPSYQGLWHSQLPATYIQPFSGIDKSEARIREVIARARRVFPLTYPNQDFDGYTWDVSHLRERTNAIDVVNFLFTKLASNVGKQRSPRPEDILPAYYANVIKSWIVESGDVSLSTNIVRLNAARHLWNFVSTRLGGQAESFKWGELTETEILAFEQFLIIHKTRHNERLKPSTIRLIIKRIQDLLDYLSNNGISRRIKYVPQTPSADRATTHTLDEKKLMAEQKLPAPGVLESLAVIYHRLTATQTSTASDWVLILISAVAILMLTGLRIGELVTLPFDCEVEDKTPNGGSSSSDSCRYGIIYWVEKTGCKTMGIKWISPTAEPVIRACITRIKGLTAAARERARVLEASPTKVTLPPEIASRPTITRHELTALLGYKKNRPIQADPQGLLPQQGRGPDSYFYVRDLEEYLLSMRVPQLHTVRHDDGTFQMLSESLFIIFAKQSRCRQMSSCRLLVEPVTADTIAYYLSGPTSLFNTYGDEDWQRGLSTSPHCFRHWLIHVAYMGGMETNLILRYFAKRYASGVADYIHFTTDESDAYAPEELSGEKFYIPA